MKNKLDEKTYSSLKEKGNRNKFYEIYKKCPIPDDQILLNLGLFLNSKTLSRINFMQYIYKKIIDVQGIIFDLGTRWGQNMAIFSSCRGMYEPFNRHRKIVGFDTFGGFPSISKQDGKSDLMKKGNVTVTKNYENYLNDIMECHEQDNPLSHIKKFEIIKGDAILTVKKYLEDNPQTIISLAYFDFDIYEPTKKCLELIKPYLVKGSILGFDELNDQDSPGETIALKEVFDINKIEIKRLPNVSRCSYFRV